MNEILVLNLKRRPEKLKKVQIELKKHNLLKNTKIITAVDGLDLNKKELIEKNIIHKNFEKITWNAGTLGSIGNYLSFVDIFKKVSKKSKNTLILEDDVYFHPDFTNIFFDILQFIKSKNLEWDVIYFGISNVTLKKKLSKWKVLEEFQDKYKILDPSFNGVIDNGDLYGMFGLYIKPKVAKGWLDGCLPMKQASDSRLGSLITGISHTIDFPTLFQTKEKKLKALVIYPPIIKYTNYVSDTSL